MTPRKKQILWILLVFTCVLSVDQITKAIIMSVYPAPERYYNASEGPTFFRFSHQRNPGIVGGIFRHKQVMAYLAPLFAGCVLVYLFRHLEMTSKLQSTAYGMIAGGAVGNYTDRIRLGSVTDFLQFDFYFIPFDFPWKYFPAFNVADSCICTGVFLLIVSWYWFEKHNVPDAA